MYRLSDGERAAGAASHTIEVSLALSYTHRATTVSAKHVVDAGSYRGAYFAEVGVSHSRALTSRTALDVAGLVGGTSRRFSRSYFGPDVRGIGLAAASVSVTRRLRGGLYLRPHVEMSVIPDSRLRATVARPLNVAVGLAIGVVQ